MSARTLQKLGSRTNNRRKAITENKSGIKTVKIEAKAVAIVAETMMLVKKMPESKIMATSIIASTTRIIIGKRRNAKSSCVNPP